ncbi:MAG: VWA domain-containing protein [Flavobacteriales bacterium]|jgi:Ca-activated chloride channel family protein|tara:strand:+ start:6592 stop:7632 length:1041 start_codon:yes stop_codon:yes gene_type:complete
MLRYEDITFLYLLAIIPLLVILFYLFLRWRNAAVEKIGSSQIVGKMMPMSSSFKLKLKFWIYSFSIASLILALANPQFGSKLEEVKREGIDIMIAIDLSNSMLAQDLPPNRLERAKQSISRMIDRLEGDRIGLVVFAGDAYVQLPITTDYSAAKLFLSTINTEIVPTQGTAIGKAIDLCIKSFDFKNGQSKSIIVITDGENHEDDAIEKAKEANKKGVIIHTIGMGSEEGGPIPLKNNRGQIKSYQKDNNGETVITKLNETMLKQIAASGNGSYIRANSTKSGLDALFNEINKMEKNKIDSKVFTDYKDRFQWLLGFSILLLLIEVILLERKNKWSNKIQLFEDEK